MSIASSDLYRKLLDDNCVFKEGQGSLHTVEDTIPHQHCRITSITVKVIGKTKFINLVAFPNINIMQTVLGMDFVSSESKSKSHMIENCEVPEQPNPKLVTPNQPTNKDIDDNEPPVALLDWILDTNNLQTPLYNILSEGAANEQDIFAICAFMKRIPRPVSPIRRLEKPRHKRLAEIKSSEINLAKKSSDKSPVVPATSVNAPSSVK